jgi:hypothetical protein
MTQRRRIENKIGYREVEKNTSTKLRPTTAANQLPTGRTELTGHQRFSLPAGGSAQRTQTKGADFGQWRKTRAALHELKSGQRHLSGKTKLEQEKRQNRLHSEENNDLRTKVNSEQGVVGSPKSTHAQNKTRTQSSNT